MAIRRVKAKRPAPKKRPRGPARPSSAPSAASTSRVSRKWNGAGWVISGAVHGTIFALLIGSMVHSKTSAAAATVSVVEMEAAPPPPPPPPPKEEPPPPPPPPPPPKDVIPEPEPEPEPQQAEPPPVNDAPPIATGEGDGTGEGWASGNNKDFGGSKGTKKGDGADKPNTPVAKKEEEAPPPPPAPPKELVDESELSVKPDIRCSPGRIAALYPQTAIDNDAEADIPVEVIVDSTGRITKPHAKTDPGFGLKEAAEMALTVACRPSAIPRDAQGNLVSARVVHTIKFQLE
jgi:protein TonB